MLRIWLLAIGLFIGGIGAAQASCVVPDIFHYIPTHATKLETMTNDQTTLVGGCIDNVPIGQNTPAAGNFSELTVNGSPVSGSVSPSGSIGDIQTKASSNSLGHLTLGTNLSVTSGVLNAAGTGSPAGSSGDFQTNNGSGGLGSLTPAAGVSTFLATPTSATLRSALTDETGGGLLYFQDGALGTPSSGNAANITNLPISTGVAGLAAGGVTFLVTPSSANLRAMLTDESGTGLAYFQGGDLGTPSAAILSSATGLPISTGVSGLATGVAAFLATPSSANLASAVTNETGSGALVFGTSPTIATPTISGNLTTNITGSVQCTHVNSSGVLSGTGSDCGAGSGGVLFVGATAGAANTYTIASPTPGGFTLTDQYVVCGTISATNTGASTLNVAATGAAAIKRQPLPASPP